MDSKFLQLLDREAEIRVEDALLGNLAPVLLPYSKFCQLNNYVMIDMDNVSTGSLWEALNPTAINAYIELHRAMRALHPVEAQYDHKLRTQWA